MAALAATGALVIAGTSVSLIGTGSAAPLDVLPISSPATTTVLPDLAPFKDNGSKGAGKAEVSDEVGAPLGGGKAALRISTPDGGDKASYATAVSGEAASLAAWIPTGAYSAYQLKADNPAQFPSLQLIVDFNGAADGGFSTLTYEPVYNPGDSTTAGEWHRYQAGAGNWCSTRAIPGVIDDSQKQCSNGGDKPLADYVAAAPDLVVQAVVINQGSGNPGLESAVDLITTPSTTYDFELTKPEPPIVIPDPTDPTTEPTSEPTTEPTTPTTAPTTEPEHPGGHGGGGEGGGQWGHGSPKDQGGHCTCG